MFVISSVFIYPFVCLYLCKKVHDRGVNGRMEDLREMSSTPL